MVSVEEGYRIPYISEFIQGFEFEIKETYGFGFIDDRNSFEYHDFWIPSKVWWMCDPNEFIEQKIGETTVLIKGSVINFHKPFDEKSIIEQGLVRVKIKKDG